MQLAEKTVEFNITINDGSLETNDIPQFGNSCDKATDTNGHKYFWSISMSF